LPSYDRRIFTPTVIDAAPMQKRTCASGSNGRRHQQLEAGIGDEASGLLGGGLGDHVADAPDADRGRGEDRRQFGSAKSAIEHQSLAAAFSHPSNAAAA
jgi:hypothetical protein